VALAAIPVLAFVVVACERTTPRPEQREAILATVEGYLEALADAYSNFDLSALEEYASPNEIAAVRKNIHDLGRLTGDRVDSTLLRFEVEHLEVFREINATVRLIEVWDVVRYDATSGVRKGHTPNSIQYSLLQLRRVEGRWLVVGRSILERETAATPTEDTAG
jgi:hypothetical protein